MAAASPSTLSTVAMHRQENNESNIAGPSPSHPLPERPKVKTHPSPVHAKPRSICRNFILRGSCRDMRCPRAHVPHRDMLDLFDYLLERDDCPSELRLIRGRFTPPSPGRNRGERRSDRICSNFLESDGVCQWQNKCFRAHLRSTQIYDSLLVKTSAVPSVPAADEHPVVKLPKKTD